MKMKKHLQLLATFFILFSVTLCSNDDLTNFQKNDPDPEFSLFDILDDFPALKSAVDSIDQRRFNDLLGLAVNTKTPELKDVLTRVDDLISHSDKPVTGSINSLRQILNQVINQDDYDFEPALDYRNSASDNAASLFNLLDLMSERDVAISEEITSILKKVISYINDTFSDDEIEEIITDLITYIKNNETYLWYDNEDNLLFDLAKLFFH